MSTSETAKARRRRRSVSSFTILLVMLIVLAVATMLMDAFGVEGVTGATIADIATAPVKGFTDALPVCLFVLILGGFLGIVTETGALDAGIAALVRKLHGNELLLIPVLMLLFSIGGTTFGMCEETVPFYLLLAATMVAAGFDSLVGAAIVLLGAGCGVLGSTVNPFAVGAAIDSLSSTDVAINQGIIIALGVVLWLVTLTISIVYVMRYAKKVKADKGSTILSLQEQEAMMSEWGMGNLEAVGASAGAGAGASTTAGVTVGGASVSAGSTSVAGSTTAASTAASTTAGIAPATPSASASPAPTTMTGRQKAVLVVLALTFVVMIVGFIPWEDLGFYGFATEWSALLTGVPLGQWYFDEASTWFLVMAVVAGVIGGVSESRFVKAFVSGAADMMSVVLIIALARSITVLMGETGLDLWILDNAADALSGVSAVVFAPLSFLLYVVLSFLVPSSSGMATVSMPIMGPLAAQLGFSVEAMIMVFSAGNGLVNLFTPTSGAIMGGLALAKIDYATWLKFGVKLFIIIGVACMVILTAAMMLLPATA